MEHVVQHRCGCCTNPRNHRVRKLCQDRGLWNIYIKSHATNATLVASVASSSGQRIPPDGRDRLPGGLIRRLEGNGDVPVGGEEQGHLGQRLADTGGFDERLGARAGDVGRQHEGGGPPGRCNALPRTAPRWRRECLADRVNPAAASPRPASAPPLESSRRPSRRSCAGWACCSCFPAKRSPPSPPRDDRWRAGSPPPSPWPRIDPLRRADGTGLEEATPPLRLRRPAGHLTIHSRSPPAPRAPKHPAQTRPRSAPPAHSTRWGATPNSARVSAPRSTCGGSREICRALPWSNHESA